jgi:hypothetical protein
MGMDNVKQCSFGDRGLLTKGDLKSGSARTIPDTEYSA